MVEPGDRNVGPLMCCRMEYEVRSPLNLVAAVPLLSPVFMLMSPAMMISPLWRVMTCCSCYSSSLRSAATRACV